MEKLHGFNGQHITDRIKRLGKPRTEYSKCRICGGRTVRTFITTRNLTGKSIRIPVGLFCQACFSIDTDVGLMTRLQLCESLLDPPEDRVQQFINTVAMREAALHANPEHTQEWYHANTTEEDLARFRTNVRSYDECPDPIQARTIISSIQLARLEMFENILARMGGD